MCKGLIGKLLGHKFVPVITKGVAEFPANMTKLNGSASTLDAFRKQTFHGMYCTRCGVRREES